MPPLPCDLTRLTRRVVTEAILDHDRSRAPTEPGEVQENTISSPQPSPAELPDLIAPFLTVLPVDRASILTLGNPFDIELLSASDAVAAEIGELQLDLGEGPSWDAYRSQLPVLVPALSEHALLAWPIFSDALAAHSARALYSFPLRSGSLRIGAVELYSQTPHALSPSEMAGATVMADTAATEVLAHAVQQIDDEAEAEGVYSRREVHQATGMVIVQARVSAEEALLLIRAHAFASGRSVREVAADITARRIQLGS